MKEFPKHGDAGKPYTKPYKVKRELDEDTLHLRKYYHYSIYDKYDQFVCTTFPRKTLAYAIRDMLNQRES